MKMFNSKVYEKLKKVPFGKITTYKDLAHAINSKAYRAVGNALNKNKDPVNIRCFKVVKSDSSIGGFALGKKEKIKRLKKEGIEVKDNKIVDFKKKLFRFKSNN